MPIDYQKLTEASLRLKITDIERARRYELEQLKQAVTCLECRTMIGYTKIPKDQFYRLGGFSNPRLVRVSRGKVWAYFHRAN